MNINKLKILVIGGDGRLFYWYNKTENGMTLKEELLNCAGVKKVVIATAFISNEGIKLLKEIKEKYGLDKKDIILYLSSEFSSNKPHELLNSLEEICTSKIIFSSFHAKVYLIYGKENKLIYGSSNFTQGGLENNVEFDYIGAPDQTDMTSVERFLSYCEGIAMPLNQDIIDYYSDCYDDIQKLMFTQNKLRAKLKGYMKKDDAFSVEDYDINDYYFTFEDYETFFRRNVKLDNPQIRAKRKKIQDKMLRIHNQIYPQIKKLGIACHKREENITSLIMPCVYNHYEVAWNGIRYGKTPKEIDALNFGGEKDDMYGFQKHGCLQCCITSDGFEINLFLAVRHDAVDRMYLHENINKLKPDITNEIENLKGYGLRWVINNSYENKQFVFDFDAEEASDFCDYFKKHDQDGCESYMIIYYAPDDESLIDIESICEEVTETIKWLLPLYNTMVFRPKV